MRNFLLGLRIRIKLLLAFGSILLMTVWLIVFVTRSIDRIISLKDVNEKVDVLKSHLDALNLSYKEFVYEEYKSQKFLEHHEASSVRAFDQNYNEAIRTISDIEDKKNDDLNLRMPLDSLHQNFKDLVSLLDKRGFKDFGLEGSLRKAIHNLENSGISFDKVSMLMLRRHEKDFFLRKDLKYQEEFNNRIDEFRKQLEKDKRTELVIFLERYKEEFNNVVEIEKLIGLAETTGIRGQIATSLSYLVGQLDNMRQTIKQQNEAQIAQARLILWIIFGVQMLVGILLALVYSNLLTTAIKEIRGGISKLATGIFPEKLKVNSSEEIGQTKTAFNQFVDRMKAAVSFSEKLGAGELSAQYDLQYADDVLAKSLVQAQDKLRQAEERQRRINWRNEGAARFNDIIKNEVENINSLADDILRLLISYLNANQGALYILKGSAHEGTLERITTYAYGKKRFVEQTIDSGSGLVGQCVKEGQTIFLSDIPKDFVKITSGLGEATPRNVLIIPLKVRGHSNGAIELATFSIFESYQIEFVEQIAESISTLLAGKQTAAHTLELLEEQERQKQVMQAKIDELTQRLIRYELTEN